MIQSVASGMPKGTSTDGTNGVVKQEIIEQSPNYSTDGTNGVVQSPDSKSCHDSGVSICPAPKVFKLRL
jgi:hypothetical protein